MRIAVSNHFGEGNAMAISLVKAGHVLTWEDPIDLFLVDLDPDCFGYREVIRSFKERGAVILQYPHGAPLSTLCYDNLYEPYELVDGQLTFSTGEAGFLHRIGCKRPTRQIGWSYCLQLPFRANPKPHKVLFAPTHPSGDCSMLPQRLETNARVFRALVKGPWEVTVRYIFGLEQNGLWVEPGVHYIQGAMDLSTKEIDDAEVVVAGAGTFPCLAVARGCPTVMYGQFDGAVYGHASEELIPLRRRTLYEDWIRYPYDFEDGTLRRVITAAAKKEATEWRSRWIGEPFDDVTFARTIENWIPELRTSSKTTALAS